VTAATTGQEPTADRFLRGTAPHGDSVLSRTGQLVGGLLSGSADARARRDRAVAVTTAVPTGRRLVVAAAKDGAGRTTVAALLASAFAARRPDPVLAVDAHHVEPSLGWRLGLSGPPMTAVAEQLEGLAGRNLESVDTLLPSTATGLRLLADPRGGRPHLARDLGATLTRLFGVTVADTGPGITSPWTVSLLADSHGIVLVCPATPEGVARTVQAVDELAAASGGAAVPRTVVALVEQVPGARLDVGAVRQAFDELAVPVHPLRYDRHLAAGGAIDVRRLGRRTLDQTLELAGAVLRTAVAQ
jgi:MinD-like ATPase involved in chromosome partitioning or flagellar assembly